MSKILKEACVESFEEALHAEKNGADRIELCSRLDLDGLTPDRKLTQQIISSLRIPVKVMIRPRGGNFVYTEKELDMMKDEIRFFKTLKIQGVVFGVLDETNHLDLRQIERLAQLAAPLEVTIHKAIDRCADPVHEVEQLLKIDGISSVLTSGGASTAIEGQNNLLKMLEVGRDSITIIPAGKITNHNLSAVHQLIGGREYHGRKIVGVL